MLIMNSKTNNALDDILDMCFVASKWGCIVQPHRFINSTLTTKTILGLAFVYKVSFLIMLLKTITCIFSDFMFELKVQ
jgi:hypothetical protein